MKKHMIVASLLIVGTFLNLTYISSIHAQSKPEVVSAFENQWGNDLNNIMITVKTNKDVDQLILKSGQGEIILSPETNYSEDDLRGNNEVMDMNGDLEVNRDDYNILKKHVDGGCKDYTATVRCSHCGATDVNNDGKIDESDLKMVDDHITGGCSLTDCYFHGTRTYREETADGYTWSVHYTPTIEGIDTMTLTPQSLTSTKTRSGEPFTLSIHSEEYKNPEILRYGVVPNQDKYLVQYKSSIPLAIYVVTPLETDKVKYQISNQLNSGDKTEIEVNEWDSIDYDKHCKFSHYFGLV